ncbi:MAG: carboxylesterase family protein [Pseudomonadota bacterium]
MMRVIRLLALATGASLLVGALFLDDGRVSALDELRPDPATRVQTDRGPVVGATVEFGTRVWLGIPYAATTAGEARWKAPQPPPSWSSDLEAIRFGPVCPQFASRLDADEQPGTLIGDEDCLSINVFAPGNLPSSSKLPVMVFVHGGGNTIGSSASYDATQFAQEQGIVIVTFNYRLGVLGWFSHRIIRESADGEYEASGNFALLDMVRALTWVRDNISTFGGDSGRVTLFGESAGGRNIFGLLASPLATGLFHGAIIQSGFPGTFSKQRAESPASNPSPGHPNSSYELLLRWLRRSPEQAEGELTELIARLPAEELMSYLRGRSAADLLKPLATKSGMYPAPALFRDGVVIPAQPLPDVFAAGDEWNRVPLVLGSNRDEQKLFLILSERFTKRRFGVFPTPRDRETYARVSRYHSGAWKAAGVDLPLQSMSTTSNSPPLFAYRFDWDDMREMWLVDLPEVLGAAHALELDFLFKPIFAPHIPGVFHRGNRESRELLARSMRDYWAGFAYHGDPGGGRSGTRTTWPRWRAAEPWLLQLDSTPDGRLNAERYWLSNDSIKAELLEDDYLGQRLKCALYVDIFLNNNGLSELFTAREYRALGCSPFPPWSLAGESR